MYYNELQQNIPIEIFSIMKQLKEFKF